MNTSTIWLSSTIHELISIRILLRYIHAIRMHAAHTCVFIAAIAEVEAKEASLLEQKMTTIPSISSSSRLTLFDSIPSLATLQSDHDESTSSAHEDSRSNSSPSSPHRHRTRGGHKQVQVPEQKLRRKEKGRMAAQRHRRARKVTSEDADHHLQVLDARNALLKTMIS